MGQVEIQGLYKILTFWASAENLECQALIFQTTDDTFKKSTSNRLFV